MTLFANDTQYARTLFPQIPSWDEVSSLEPDVRRLLDALCPGAAWVAAPQSEALGFDRVVMVDRASESQFDLLRDLARDRHSLPGSTACLAGSGNKFHGHRGRSWTAVEGNLHLSVLVTPNQAVRHFGAAFLALPAVATAEAIEEVVPKASPVGIKWVNDVVRDGAKLAGVIAHSRTAGNLVERVILGIGLNVETTPQVERSPFVPRAGALCEIDPTTTQQRALSALLKRLTHHYAALLEAGPHPLISAYRARSVVMGQWVEIHPEADQRDEVVAGRIIAISDDLELQLDGREAPVQRGRLMLPSRGASNPTERRD